MSFSKHQASELCCFKYKNNNNKIIIIKVIKTQREKKVDTQLGRWCVCVELKRGEVYLTLSE